MSQFRNKVVVITGAGSGIGRALAQQLATEGARLALSDVNEQGLDGAVVEKMLLTSPDDCAADIIAGLKRGDKRILTGYKSSTLSWLSRLVPDHYHAVLNLLAR